MSPENLESNASSETSNQDALDILNSDSDSDAKEAKSTDEDFSEDLDVSNESSEDEETKEGKESETDEEELDSDENEDDKVDEITRPSWKNLKESKAFKSLPKEQQEEFRQVFHREKAFTETFPTVEEAKIAADKAGSFDYIATELSNGNVAALVQNLNSEELTLFSKNVLGSLREADENAFKLATAPIISELLHSAVEYAKSNNDENLEKSAYNIAKLLFGVKFGQLPPRGNNRPNPEVERERAKFVDATNRLAAQQKGQFLESADKSIKNRLEKEILSGLSDVENEYLKKGILRDTLDEVKSLLNNDKAFNEQMGRLVSQAEKSGYAPEHMTRVVSAYLNRAKAIAARSRTKFKSSALGKQSAKSTEKKNPRVEGTGKETKGNGVTNLKGAEKRNFYRGKTDLDIINS